MSPNDQNSNDTSQQSTDRQNLKQRPREKSLQSVIPEPTPPSDDTKVERTASTDQIKSASRDSSSQPSGGQHLKVYIYPNQISTPEQSKPSNNRYHKSLRDRHRLHKNLRHIQQLLRVLCDRLMDSASIYNQNKSK